MPTRLLARSALFLGFTLALAATSEQLAFADTSSTSASVQARPPSPEELAMARSWFRQAQAAQEAERWDECAQRMDEALRIYESPGLLYHRAFCNEQRRLWVEALTDYRRAAAMISAGIPADDVKELLRATLPRLEGQIPSLIVQVDELPPGASLYLGGKEYPVTLIGRAIPMNPGSRSMSVNAPGYLPVTHDVSLLPGETRKVRIVLTREKPATSNKPAELTTDSGSAKPYVMVVEGSLALLGLGGALILQYDQSLQSGDRKFWSQVPCPVNSSFDCGKAERESATFAKQLRVAAYISGSVAAVAAVSLLGTWLLWPTESKVSAALYPTPSGGAASLTVKF